jgi:hypothetical protein
VAQQFTGTTTASLVTVFDKTNSNGLHGSFAVYNTGGTNGLSRTVTFKDMQANTGTSTVTLAANNTTSFALDSSSPISNAACKAPFQEVKLQVQDQTGGAHTTFVVWLSTVG